MPMHFHHRRQSEALREARLIFDAETPPPAPTARELNTLETMLSHAALSNPEAVNEITQARAQDLINRASKTVAERSQAFSKAIANAARLQYDAYRAAGRTHEDALKQVAWHFQNTARLSTPAGEPPQFSARLLTSDPEPAVIVVPPAPAAAPAPAPAAPVVAPAPAPAPAVPAAPETAAKTAGEDLGKRFNEIVSTLPQGERATFEQAWNFLRLQLPVERQTTFLNVLTNVAANDAQRASALTLFPRVRTFVLSNATNGSALLSLTAADIDNPGTISNEAVQKFIQSLSEGGDGERAVLKLFLPSIRTLNEAENTRFQEEQQKKMVADAQAVMKREIGGREPRTLSAEKRDIVMGRVMMQTGVDVEWDAATNSFKYNAPSENFEGIMIRLKGIFMIISAYKAVLTGERRNSTSGSAGERPETAGETMEKRIAAINNNPLNRYVRLTRQTTEGRTNILIQADRQPNAAAREDGQTFSEQVVKALTSIGITMNPDNQSANYNNVDDASMQALEKAIRGILNAGADSVVKSTMEGILKTSGGTFTEQDRKALNDAFRTPNTWVRTAGRPGGEYDLIAVGDRVFTQNADGTLCVELSATRSPVLHTNRFFNSRTGAVENIGRTGNEDLILGKWGYNAENRAWEQRTPEQMRSYFESQESPERKSLRYGYALVRAFDMAAGFSPDRSTTLNNVTTFTRGEEVTRRLRGRLENGDYNSTLKLEMGGGVLEATDTTGTMWLGDYNVIQVWNLDNTVNAVSTFMAVDEAPLDTTSKNAVQQIKRNLRELLPDVPRG